MIAHIRFSEFFVQVERARAPATAGRPLVVGGPPDGPGSVAAASSEARQLGVRAGMRLGEAARRCPHARFVDGNLEDYLAASMAVDEVVRRVSDGVEWTALDELWLDLGRDVAFSAGRLAVDAVRDACRDELALAGAIGVASSRTAARVASALAAPSGFVLVLPGYERVFLSPIDVGVLDVRPPLLARLQAAGLHTLGAVANAEPAALETIVGAAAARLRASARGLDVAADLPATPPRSLGRTCELVQPARRLDAVLPVARSVAMHLAGLARQRGYFVGAVSVQVQGERRRVTRSLALRQPSHDEADLVPVVLVLATQAWRAAGHLATSIVVRWSRLHSARGQLPLFPEPSRAATGEPRTRAQLEALEAARAATRRRYAAR